MQVVDVSYRVKYKHLPHTYLILDEIGVIVIYLQKYKQFYASKLECDRYAKAIRKSCNCSAVQKFIVASRYATMLYHNGMLDFVEG